MSDLALRAGLVALLGGGSAVIAYLFLTRDQGDETRYVQLTDAERILLERDRLVTVGTPSRRATATATAQEPDVVGALTQAAVLAFWRPALEAVTRVGGEAIETGAINLAAVANPVVEVAEAGFVDQVADLANPFEGGALIPSSADLGDAVTSLGALANTSKVVVDAAIKLAGLRGATDEEQEKILADLALQTVQSVIGVVPVLGPLLSGLTGLLAGTYEGQKVLADAGAALQDAYDFQKDLVAGDVKGALGLDSHKRERLRRLLQAAREVQPESDLRYVAAQDEAARGTYAGSLAGTELARFDAILRAESTLNAAELAEQQRLTEEFNAQQAANTAATLAANEAYVAAGLFTALDQLREWRAGELTVLNAARSAERTRLDSEWTWKINAARKTWSFALAASLTAERDAALAALDQETARLSDAIYEDYAARAAAAGGVL